ncbi:MAG: transglycosylase domain-containing protein [Candidatus Scatovivens sp.]
MKILKRTILVIILMIIITLIAITSKYIYQGYVMYIEAIKETPISEKVKNIKENENYTKIENLPQMYINAVIAVEDHRFYNHGAIDIISIGRAIYTNIRELELVEGGSTITQQLAKNIYFTQEKKLVRKIAEVFMAFKIEKACSKDEILELYVNTSYFGDGYYNVKEASNGYFDKEPIEMDDYECTLLAGIPNAPSVYAPTKNPDLARQRQEQVISKMIKYKYITNNYADEILERAFEY